MNSHLKSLLHISDFIHFVDENFLYKIHVEIIVSQFDPDIVSIRKDK